MMEFTPTHDAFDNASKTGLAQDTLMKIPRKEYASYD
jgi:hypothetical protein